MKTTSTGWIAERRNGKPFAVADPRAKGMPTGIYLNFTHTGLHLNYAGIDTRSNGVAFLPNRPRLLRELAAALNEAADIYSSGKGPPLYPLHSLAKNKRKKA